MARSKEHRCSISGKNTCVWKDHEGNIYNLSSLKDESDFIVKGVKYKHFTYSYHPCRWLRLNGACNRSSKAALCKWVSYLSDLNDFSNEALGKGNQSVILILYVWSTLQKNVSWVLKQPLDYSATKTELRESLELKKKMLIGSFLWVTDAHVRMFVPLIKRKKFHLQLQLDHRTRIWMLL